MVLYMECTICGVKFQSLEDRIKHGECHMKKVVFETKDSGVRESFDSGMVRDTQKGKPRYDLCFKPLYKRWAELMGRGAEKYGENNWMKAAGEAELARFKASAERHLQQYLEGDRTEDHAAAVLFNLGGAEYVRSKIDNNS